MTRLVVARADDAASNAAAATIASVWTAAGNAVDAAATVEPPSGETVAVVAAPVDTDAVVVEAAAVDATDRAAVGDAAPVDAAAPAAAVDRAEGAVPAVRICRAAAVASTQVTPMVFRGVPPPFVR